MLKKDILKNVGIINEGVANKTKSEIRLTISIPGISPSNISIQIKDKDLIADYGDIDDVTDTDLQDLVKEWIDRHINKMRVLNIS